MHITKDRERAGPRGTNFWPSVVITGRNLVLWYWVLVRAYQCWRRTDGSPCYSSPPKDLHTSYHIFNENSGFKVVNVYFVFFPRHE